MMERNELENRLCGSSCKDKNKLCVFAHSNLRLFKDYGIALCLYDKDLSMLNIDAQSYNEALRQVIQFVPYVQNTEIGVYVEIDTSIFYLMDYIDIIIQNLAFYKPESLRWFQKISESIAKKENYKDKIVFAIGDFSNFDTAWKLLNMIINLQYMYSLMCVEDETLYPYDIYEDISDKIMNLIVNNIGISKASIIKNKLLAKYDNKFYTLIADDNLILGNEDILQACVFICNSLKQSTNHIVLSLYKLFNSDMKVLLDKVYEFINKNLAIFVYAVILEYLRVFAYKTKDIQQEKMLEKLYKDLMYTVLDDSANLKGLKAIRVKDK